MKSAIFLLCLTLIPAQRILAQTNWYHCEFPVQQGPRQLTLYSSDAFEAAAADDPAIQIAWNKYIQANYSVKQQNAGVCQNSTLWGRDPKNSVTTWERKSEQQTPGVTVVHVPWSYTSATAAAAPAPPSPQGEPCVLEQHRITPCPQAPMTSYVVCSANDLSPTAYVSATFAVTAMDTAAWAGGFGQFLAGKYGYQGGGVGCNVLHDTTAQTFFKNRVIGLRANGKNVVETGWTYNSLPAIAVDAPPPAPAPAAPTPPPAAAARGLSPRTPQPAQPAARPPAKPTDKYVVCYAQSPTRKEAYFSALFLAAPGSTNAEWTAQFRAYVIGQYGKGLSVVNCGARNTQEDAQQQAQTWMQANERAKNKVVETGWKLQ